MGVEIRRLRPADASVLSRVAVEVFDEPVEPMRLAAYLAAPGHLMVVAVVDDIVVGQCAAVIHRHPDKPAELYIDEVGVALGFRRQGIARRMIEEIFAWGREAGCEESWVGTEFDNHPARRLYETRGSAKAEPFVMYQYDLSA